MLLPEPSPPRDGGSPREEAERLFLDHLETHLDNDVEKLCAQRPDLAAELRELSHAYQTAMPLVERLASESGASPARDSGRIDENVLDALTQRRLPSDRYRTHEMISEGGMGRIFRTWDEDLKRTLAMKVRKSEEEPSHSTNLVRFLEEAQITGQLDHPGIVPVHDLGVDPSGSVYFTMRLVRGTTLKEILDSRLEGSTEWTQARILQVLLRACEAVAFAHAKGVIHRDLKPSNIMVGKFGETYVMDWGLAKVQGRETRHRTTTRETPKHTTVQTVRRLEHEHDLDAAVFTLDGDIVGTPAYMPPEQAQGRQDLISPRADVYSMGAALYHLLAGHMPYVTKGTQASVNMVLGWVRERAPDPLSRVRPRLPMDLIAICEKAMARDPQDRYEDMAEMAEDLRAFLDQRVVAAYRTGAVAEFRKWVTRNRGFAQVSLAAFLFMIVALGGLLYMYNESHRKEDLLRREADTIQAMVDAQAAERLYQEVDELWPRREEVVPRMNQWLERAEIVAERLEQDIEALIRLRDQRSSLLDSGQNWISQKIEFLTTLLGKEVQWVAAILERRAYAQSIARKTIDNVEDHWMAFFDDLDHHPIYKDVPFTDPIVGLIPLGRDPLSELHEFLLYESGEAPSRDPKTGHYLIEEETGMVLVLLPGAPNEFGSKEIPETLKAEDRPRFMDYTCAVQHWDLDPFMISKYEITQAQWMRLTQSTHNPSIHKIGLTGPVDSVSWYMAVEILGRYGLELPTMRQWEYGTRAGTNGLFCTGESPRSLRLHANLLDDSFRKIDSGLSNYSPWDDGFAYPAPVGSYLPNAFGLHDVHGNVWEWCFDRASTENSTNNDVFDLRKKSIRGGSFYRTAWHSRSVGLEPNDPESQEGDLGIRPVLNLWDD